MRERKTESLFHIGLLAAFSRRLAHIVTWIQHVALVNLWYNGELSKTHTPEMHVIDHSYCQEWPATIPCKTNTDQSWITHTLAHARVHLVSHSQTMENESITFRQL